MFEIGEYVAVDLGNEVRRGIVATIEDGAMVDVILLQEYGNNKTGEVIDEAEYPTFSLMSVKKLEGEFKPWMVEAVTVEELRKIAAKFFGNKDWRGAITVYKEILHRLAISDKGQFFLLRVDNTIRLGQSANGTESFLHYGVIDPASESQFVHGSSQHVNMTINPASLYRVFTPFHLHATVLLNLGRTLFNANCGNEGVGILSYAIYTAALSQETGAQTLRSKAYFWRAKARMGTSKIDGALRDASTALSLSDQETRRDCHVLRHQCEHILCEQRLAMRKVSRELMTLLDDQIRKGKLDINI